MIYLEGISAFEFWTSLARARVNIQKIPRVSSLAGSPSSARESAEVGFGTIPCTFSQLEVAVPDGSFRVQRKRFKYHVWSKEVPRDSFLVISRDVCIASPALTLAQVSRKLDLVRLSQAVCEMRGSYLRLRGRNGGMLDELEPIVAEDEIAAVIEATRNVYDCSRLETALSFSRAGSASPKETELLLLLAMTKRRGGAAIGGWEMNVELEVPLEYRGYLGKNHVRPDLLNAEKRVDVEYDSGLHDDPVRAVDDRKRRKVLRAMGYQIVPVHGEDIADARAFEGTVSQVKEKLGMRYRRTSEEGIAARQRLMDTMRTMPSIGYP